MNVRVLVVLGTSQTRNMHTNLEGLEVSQTLGEGACPWGCEAFKLLIREVSALPLL